jgi:hypothetical protein
VIRALPLLALSALLAACGSTVHARTVAPARARGTDQAPNTPICAFYGTTVAVGLLAQHPHDAGVTIARLRPRWPSVVREAEQGGRVQWRGPAARDTRAAYALFLGDVRHAGAAIDGDNMRRFQAAIRSAKTHLVALDDLAKRSRLSCKIVSADGSTMTFGG